MWERDEEKTGIDGLTLWGMGGQQHGEPRWAATEEHIWGGKTSTGNNMQGPSTRRAPRYHGNFLKNPGLIPPRLTAVVLEEPYITSNATSRFTFLKY
jgi:hypothetical protein